MPGLVRWEGNENGKGAARSVGREPAMLSCCSSLRCCVVDCSWLLRAILLCRLQEHVLHTGAHVNL